MLNDIVYCIQTVFLPSVIILCIIWIVDRKRRYRLFENIGIKCPPTSLIDGNALEYLNDPIGTLNKWSERFGNIYGYFYGPKPYLVISDLDILKTILIKDFSNFMDRPEMPIAVKPIIYSLVHLSGEHWKEVRRKITPAFTSSKIKYMSTIINHLVNVLVEVIKDKNGQPFDIYDDVQALTMDVIGHCALALKVDCLRNSEESLLIKTKEYMHNATNAAVKLAIMFPSVAKLMVILNDKLAAGQVSDDITNNLTKVMAFRRKMRDSEPPLDMLQLILEAKDENGVPLRDEEVTGSLFAFVIAGYETTANALAYTFYLLAKHQDVQEELRIEISELDSDPGYDDIMKLNLLDRVFAESLRLYPPVVTFVARSCMKSIKIGDLFIPKGVSVQVPVYQIHHDPDIWQDPEEFRPDRFLPENKGDIHPMAYLPFGAGKRSCIGSRFALFEAKLTIAKVIKNFKLTFCDETEEPLTMTVPTVTANPANGVVLKATKR